MLVCFSQSPAFLLSAAGFAQPIGEAHRHEPPVPRDEVVVDEGQDRDEPEDKQPPANKEVLVEENLALGEEQAKPQPALKQPKGESSQEKLADQPVKDAKPLPGLDAQEDKRPPYKDLQLDQQDKKRDEDVGGQDEIIAQEKLKPVEKENDTGKTFPCVFLPSFKASVYYLGPPRFCIYVPNNKLLQHSAGAAEDLKKTHLTHLCFSQQ